MIQGPKIISGFPDDDEDSYYLTADKLPFEDDEGENSGLLIERPITDICTYIWKNHDLFFSTPLALSDKLVSFAEPVTSDDPLISFFTRFYIANKPLFDLLAIKVETLLFLAQQSVFLLFAQPGHSNKDEHQLPLVEFLYPSTIQTKLLLNLHSLKSPSTPTITISLFVHTLNVFHQGSTIAPPQTKSNPHESFSFRLSWRNPESSVSLDEAIESAKVPVSGSAESCSAASTEPLVIHASQDQMINNDILVEWKNMVFDSLLRWRYSLESTLGLEPSDTELDQPAAFADPPDEVTSGTPQSAASDETDPSSSDQNILLDSIEKLHSTSDIITIVPMSSEDFPVSSIVEALAEIVKAH